MGLTGFIDALSMIMNLLICSYKTFKERFNPLDGNAQNAFDALKIAMTKAPVLSYLILIVTPLEQGWVQFSPKRAIQFLSLARNLALNY